MLFAPAVAPGDDGDPSQAAVRRRLAAARITAATLLVMLAAASYVWFFGWSTSLPDVTAYWRAATNLVHGASPYAPPPPGPSPKAYLYPPAFAVLFSPLTLLEPVAGYGLWMALHFVFLFAVVAAGAQLAGIRSVREQLVYLVLLVAWLPPAVGGDFQEGQANLFVASLFVLGLLGVERRRDALAGFLLALAVHAKLLPVVLLAALAAQRRFRAVAFAAAFLVALVFLPALVTVPREGLVDGFSRAVTLHLEWAGTVLAPAAADARVVGAEQFYVLNNSVTAVLHRLFGDVAFSPFPQLAAWKGPLLFELPRWLIRVLAGAIGAGLVAGSLVFAYRNASSAAARVAAWSLSVAAIELATLNCWEHHLVLMALVAAALAALPGVSRATMVLTAVVTVSWTLPYVLGPLAAAAGVEWPGALLRQTRTWGVPTFAVIALAVTLARDASAGPEDLPARTG